MSKKVAYVKHPVTPAQKIELREQGFKIIDARFAPKGAEVINLNEKKSPPKAEKK